MPVGELERQLTSIPDGQVLTGEQISGEFSKLSSLQILDGTIITGPVRRLKFSNVNELRVDGEHEAYFPREGIAFKNERPVKAISTESHPQFLVVEGKVQPVYHVKNMYIDLPNRTGDGILEQTVIYVLGFTDFRHWAEYISLEEQALLERKKQLVGLAQVKKILSMSPDVTLVFPDGTVDARSGRQVAEYRGKIPEGKLEAYHRDTRQQLQLPKVFGVEGRFSFEGSGNVRLPDDTLSRYGGTVSGRLDYSNGRGTLSGSLIR